MYILSDIIQIVVDAGKYKTYKTGMLNLLIWIFIFGLYQDNILSIAIPRRGGTTSSRKMAPGHIIKADFKLAYHRCRAFAKEMKTYP
ncbi:MAG: hypothetical protein IPM26_17210 [Saprospiraceae bacterium]|nr:hypothetical protein [Saprospiraceae bacterium]